MSTEKENGQTAQAKTRETKAAGPPTLPGQPPPAGNSPPPPMPSQIGHYQILKVLYYDPEGQSIVYEAWDPDLQRKVALKTVNWPFLGPEATEHFLHEMRTLAEVVHPNVVPVLTAGNDAGVLYYTTPLIDGLSLDKHVENRRAQMRERLKLFARVCEVVDALHERNKLHLDLKPPNTIIDMERNVWLLDFGLAKAVAEVAPRGLCGGTIPYMAPEQTGLKLAPAPEQLTTQTDVYALGVILYWLLTGDSPFKLTGRVPEDHALICTATPTPARQKNPKIPQVLADLLVACLQKDPAKRPRTAGELADTVRAYLDLEGKRNGRWWRWILAVALSLAALVLVLLRPWSRGDQAGQVALDTNTPPPTNVVGQSGTDTNQAGPSSPTNPPLPNPAAPEVPAEVFTAAQLGPVTNATGDSLPTALWPAKTAASDKLKFTYAFHRHGVVLVFFNPSDKTGKASLTCSVPKTGAQRKVALEPGGAAIFYVPGLQECSLDLDYNGQSTQQTVVPEAGEVAYRLMP